MKANSLKKLHLYLTVVWGVLLIPSVIWWRNSILWVVLMSAYAIVVSHWGAYQATRAEESQEDPGVKIRKKGK